MAEDNPDDPFVHIRNFGWDPNKRDKVLRARNIDFDDMRLVITGPILVERSDRSGEIRHKVVGVLDDVEIAFICTFRGDLCWVITARRARRDERKKYRDSLARRSPQGEN
jgi:uncharacterized DUF497 family protein